MIFRVLNRLIGRTDSSLDAVNAYVEGNASPDEIKLIEQMVRENPALEKDLTTQRSLLQVLDRVDNIEAPRSFAVTPEMVAAAERSESRLSRLAELFAPQRKLALAPAVIAGITALGVALLTLGDITGVVDQNRLSGEGSFTTTKAAEIGRQTEGGVSIIERESESSVADDVIVTIVVEKQVAGDSGSDGSTEMAASTDAPVATALVSEAQAPVVAPESEDSSLAAKAVAPDGEPEADADVIGEQPSSIAAAPPALVVEVDGDSLTENDIPAVAPEISELVSPDDLEAGTVTTSSLGYGVGGEIADGAADGAALGAAEGAAAGAADGAASNEGKGISLPLWQLQIALAALAIAAIGAWAGLRRARGE